MPNIGYSSEVRRSLAVTEETLCHMIDAMLEPSSCPHPPIAFRAFVPSKRVQLRRRREVTNSVPM